MPDFELTFLGTGTSIGVPAIGCDCETCRSTDQRDKRTRCSVWCRTPEAAWVVDTGPDFRAQCLREGIRRLDAALYTHAHMDHVTGFDELRRFTVEQDHYLPVHATAACLASLERMFEYAFNGENRYRGYLKPWPMPVHGPFKIGETLVTPLAVLHGKLETIGYLFSRAGNKLCAYLCDCKSVPPESLAAMQGVDTLIIDALRFTPHPTHMNIEESLAFVDTLRPRAAFFTHFQCEVMHARDEPKMPPHVRFAFDGLRLAW
ncbi:MAG: MBL fold metallo-hydrolase [Verrucomicrobiaceae bacterium]|nr:MBL fold metallo-hydrolase [Verrucomicrobiaceae bacterium]